MKRVFIIHGWEFDPSMHWYPWLAHELQGQGVEVHVPKMPSTSKPEIKTWIAAIAKEVGTLDKDTCFVGHSIGCQAILRYLETQSASCGKSVFVGGWFILSDEATPDDEYRRIAEPWLQQRIDFDKLKTNSYTAFLSEDDPIHRPLFRKRSHL